MSILFQILVRIASYGQQIDHSQGENRLSHIINLFTACSSCSDSEERGKEESRGKRTGQKKGRGGEKGSFTLSPHPTPLLFSFPTLLRFTSRRPDYLKTWNRLITKGLPFLSEMIQRNPSLNLIRLLRVVITLSVTGLLRGENDLKQWDEIQPIEIQIFRFFEQKVVSSEFAPVRLCDFTPFG